ncbi:MAG: hypothetical protein ACLSTI_07080 [Ruminococcus sp.]
MENGAFASRQNSGTHDGSNNCVWQLPLSQAESDWFVLLDKLEQWIAMRRRRRHVARSKGELGGHPPHVFEAGMLLGWLSASNQNRDVTATLKKTWKKREFLKEFLKKQTAFRRVPAKLVIMDRKALASPRWRHNCQRYFDCEGSKPS